MTLEDPFYVVKDEVFRALNKTRGLYLRWQELSAAPSPPADLHWTSIELRNALRSIEWDLEDLDDTIGIVEKNPSKFKIDHKEVCDRRNFIETTRQEVQVMKNKISMNRNYDKDGTAREPLLGEGEGGGEGGAGGFMAWSSTPKYSQYSQLASQDSPRTNHADDLAVIDSSVTSLKSLSTYIGNELDEQAIMLDELNSELENTDSKLYTTVVKISKVLHLNKEGSQWAAILLLVSILIVLIILFIVL